MNFGFWIGDFGFGDLRHGASSIQNPKSKIQNQPIFWPQLGQNFAPGARLAWHCGHFPAADTAMLFPQLGQNFAPCGASAWHFGHFVVATIGPPQFEQNFAPAGFGVWHFGQAMV